MSDTLNTPQNWSLIPQVTGSVLYSTLVDLAIAEPTEFWSRIKTKDWYAIKQKVPVFVPPLKSIDIIKGWSDLNVRDVLMATLPDSKERELLCRYINRSGRGPWRRFLCEKLNFSYGFETLGMRERSEKLFIGIVSRLWTKKVKNKYEKISRKNPLTKFLRAKHLSLYMAIHQSYHYSTLMVHFGYMPRSRLSADKKKFINNPDLVIRTFLQDCETTGKWQTKDVGKTRLTNIKRLLKQHKVIVFHELQLVAKLMANQLTYEDVRLMVDDDLKSMLKIAAMHGDFTTDRFPSLKLIALRFTRLTKIMHELGITIELPPL